MKSRDELLKSAYADIKFGYTPQELEMMDINGSILRKYDIDRNRNGDWVASDKATGLPVLDDSGKPADVKQLARQHVEGLGLRIREVNTDGAPTDTYGPSSGRPRVTVNSGDQSKAENEAAAKGYWPHEKRYWDLVRERGVEVPDGIKEKWYT